MPTVPAEDPEKKGKNYSALGWAEWILAEKRDETMEKPEKSSANVPGGLEEDSFGHIWEFSG